MNPDEEFEPDIEAIVEALRNDPVYVAPETDGAIADEDLQTLQAQVADHDDWYVIAVPMSPSASISQNQMVTLVQRELGEPGVFVVTQQIGERWSVDIVHAGAQESRDLWYAMSTVGHRYPADLGRQLVDGIELFESGDAEQVWNEEVGDTGSTQPAQDYGEDDGGPVFEGWMIGALGALALVTAFAVWRRRRAEAKRFSLDKRAVERISEAQTSSWRRRAEAAFDSLGRQIGRHEVDATADQTSWSAALDHYDVARAALARSDDAADSVGALIVAERGLDALSAAVERRTWSPEPRCFFNPLHGTATERVDWTNDAGTGRVPACESCAGDLAQRREPEFLDLPYGDSVVHYVDAHAEPWSSTGYGSLEFDLVSAWNSQDGD